ncbi:hypothetical protein JHK82_040281 [Glycine max]|nr:hypothetical protein JHK82_040281 [Glycine max]
MSGDLLDQPQKQSVEERARTDTGIAYTQIMTSERSRLPPLQNDSIENFHEAWNSR